MLEVVAVIVAVDRATLKTVHASRVVQLDPCESRLVWRSRPVASSAADTISDFYTFVVIL